MTKAITFTQEEIDTLLDILKRIAVSDIRIPDIQVDGRPVMVSIGQMSGFAVIGGSALFDVLRKLEKY